MKRKTKFFGKTILIILGLFFLGLFLSLLFSSTSHANEKKKLTIYAYSSFVSAWGPGPKLIENFKKTCDCEIDLTDMGETNLVFDKLARLKSTRVDLLVGLDQMTLTKAQKKMQWQNVKSHKKNGYVGSKEYDNFVAFDWAPMAFVYKKSELPQPPQSLDDLLLPAYKGQILLEDPRLSTPGLQFLAWVWLSKKNKTKDYLAKLKNQIHSVSPSWSTAYGLFKKDQAKLVFSYLSSPTYHWKEEKNENYQSLAFKEKHAVQTEWVGIPKNCASCELAGKFIDYLLSNESQELLMNFNFMYPVNMSLSKGTLFEKLPVVQTYEISDYKKIDPEMLLNLWKDAMK